MTETKAAGPPPTERELHEAALAYLDSFVTPEAGLIRVLDRKITRWARLAANVEPDVLAGLRQAARRVAARLVAQGIVNDTSFAAGRVRHLTRTGSSRRKIEANLAARGVDAETIRLALLPDPEAELAAAVAFTRKRRIGAFRRDEDADPKRELGLMARAGFARSVAEAALQMEPGPAEDLLIRLKQA